MFFQDILILSLIQGITEFLPISSSGHLLIASTFLHIKNNVLFNLSLHIGTVLSLLIYFYKDIYKLSKTLILFITLQNKNLYLIPHIIISTIPAAILGILFLKYDLENSSYALFIFAINSIIFGTILYLSDKFSQSQITFDKINKKQAFLIGLAQSIAIIPGVSRLGICMTASRFLKIDKISSVKYSMLISIPIILGGALVHIAPQIKNPNFPYFDFLLGIILSCIVGVLVIKILLSFIAKYSYKTFMIYRILLGIFILLYFYIL